MTAVLDTETTAPAGEPTPDARLASWAARAGALAVDTVPGLALLATAALLIFTSPAQGWARWVFTGLFAVTFLAMAVNRLVLPIVTGWSLGRALFGIAVERQDDTSVGIGRLAVRELAHLLDTAAVGVGWLWPLWDRRNRTFADLLARTEVRRVERPQRDMRRFVAKVLIVVALLCVATTALGYGVVYRQERAVDAAAQEIAAQGPRIVEQMLSYGIETMPDDFARAQSLTTDGYRSQLIEQQQAVQNSVAKGDAAANEYWAVNSAVLSNPPVTADSASMLLAMQGQRGTKPEDMKFITATVQVEFAKSSDGQWRVSNLTVLKKPLMNVAGQ